MQQLDMWRGLRLVCLVCLHLGMEILPNSNIATVQGNFIIPGLSKMKVNNLQDINIGVILSMTQRSSDGNVCGTKLNMQAVHLPLVIRLGLANAVFNFSNTTGESRLGFVILDDCSKPGVAAAHALAFLGDPRSCTDKNDITTQSCNHESNPDAIEEYDVVGVIGPMSTSSAIAVNQVLEPASMPVVSFSATGDALNEKTYPYFFSNVLRDSFQLRAITELIAYFNWTFVSVVYGDNYLKAFKVLKVDLEAKNICLDSFAHISSDDSTAQKQAQKLVQTLTDKRPKFKRARVVIILHDDPVIVRRLLTAKNASDLQFPPIWVGMGNWGQKVASLRNVYKNMEGALLVTYRHTPSIAFQKALQTVDKDDIRKSPWMRTWYEAQKDPEKAFQSLNKEIHSDNLLNVVEAYRASIFRLLETCQAQRMRDCITGPKLKEELKSSSMVQHMESISFFTVSQIQRKSDKKGEFAEIFVGQINTMTMKVNISKNVTFLAVKGFKGTDKVNKKLVTSGIAPISLCSFQCKPWEIKKIQHLPCCWLCRSCREGEYPSKNRMECLSCELFMWPDETTQPANRCLAIPVDHLQVSSPIGGLLASLTAIQLCLVLVVLAVFVKHRQCLALNLHANFRLFTFMNLAGVVFHQVAVILILGGAEEWTCRAVYWLHSFSVFFVFLPFFMKAMARVLLLRTIRMNVEGDLEQMSTVYPGARVQVIVIFLLFVLLNLVMAVQNRFGDEWVVKTQKSPREKLVEECCSFPIGVKKYGFVPQLAFLFAVELFFCSVCSLLIFKSRHLPVGFNDFRFQPAFIATLIITGVCIAPAIGVANMEVMKEGFFTLILSIDVMGALLFLVCPTVYAIFYMPDAVLECNETTLKKSRKEYFSSLQAYESRREYLSSLHTTDTSKSKRGNLSSFNASESRRHDFSSLHADDNKIEGLIPSTSVSGEREGAKL